MPDIFGGATLPAWLDRRTSGIDPLADKLGQSLGTGVAELFTALERDPNATEDASWWDSRKGLKQASAEVRMNQTDPLWKQKFGMTLKNQALREKSAWTGIDLNLKRMDVMDAQMAAKKKVEEDEASDQGDYAQWIGKIGNDSTLLADSPVPPFRSNKYRMLASTAINGAKTSSAYLETRDKLLQQRQDAHQMAIESREQQVSDTKEFRTSLQPLGAAARARIGAPKGPNGTYTDEQWGMLNDELTAAGLPLAGQKSATPKESLETKIRLDSLKSDAADIRKSLHSAPEEEKDALRQQLQENEAEQLAIASGKAPSITSVAPVDPFQKQVAAATDKLNDAIAREDKKGVEAAKKELSVLNRKQSLKLGIPPITKSLSTKDVEEIVNKVPLGGSLYIDATGKWKKIETEQDRQAILSQLGTKKAAVAGSGKGTGATTSALTAPESPPDTRKRKISALETKQADLDKKADDYSLGLDDRKAAESESKAVAAELARLKAQDQSSKSKDDGKFKFLSTVDAAPAWQR